MSLVEQRLTSIGPSGVAQGAEAGDYQQISFAAFARGEYAYDNENLRGVELALMSSVFVGASFIIKKKGLQQAAQSGRRANEGGYAYLNQPLWWVGMATMIGGEFANLAAYAYAPAIVVTPLGATTIIISAILANCFLGESMHACGIFACLLTVCGSVVLVSYAPNEAPIASVEEIWQLATQPQFLIYSGCVILLSILLIQRCAPRYGRTHLLVYVLICSLIGSLSVVSCKAIGIALKLTLRGSNQLLKRETLAFASCCCVCVVFQMNYLNKVRSPHIASPHCDLCELSTPRLLSHLASHGSSPRLLSHLASHGSSPRLLSHGYSLTVTLCLSHTRLLSLSLSPSLPAALSRLLSLTPPRQCGPTRPSTPSTLPSSRRLTTSASLSARSPPR